MIRKASFKIKRDALNTRNTNLMNQVTNQMVAWLFLFLKVIY